MPGHTGVAHSQSGVLEIIPRLCCPQVRVYYVGNTALKTLDFYKKLNTTHVKPYLCDNWMGFNRKKYIGKHLLTFLISNTILSHKREPKQESDIWLTYMYVI